jgi:hypothetical protein
MHVVPSLRYVIVWCAVLAVCVGAYTALFAPCVSRYPGLRVVKSAYCDGKFYDCSKQCFFDVDSEFCLVVSNNCTLALQNGTHLQIGQYVYYKSSVYLTNTTLVDSVSIAWKAQRC